MEISEKISKEFLAETKQTDKMIDAIWNKYEFNGVTLDAWDEQFFIQIPKDPKPADVRKLFREIAENIQSASIYYGICSSVLTFLVYAKKRAFDKKIEELVEDYNTRNAKRPAKDIIQSLALSSMEDIEFQLKMFEILKSFWKEKRDISMEVRKNLEQIHISMSTELKYLDR